MTLVPVLILVTLAQAPGWSPPANPDPEKILREARAAASAGRNEEALAKYLWFHRNAVKLKKSLHGVRNSYAVSEWSLLGEVYAPAREKLLES